MVNKPKNTVPFKNKKIDEEEFEGLIATIPVSLKLFQVLV